MVQGKKQSNNKPKFAEVVNWRQFGEGDARECEC